MKSLVSTRRPFAGIPRPFAPAAAVLLVLAAISAQADWPSTNATKWVQYPDRTKTGYDVLAAQSAAGAPPLIVADDFPCQQTGPITDIHLWTSWLGDTPNQNIPITLSIWSDVPAITNAAGVVTPSHPGSRLWSQTFNPGQYQIKAWATADEQFWNPDPWPAGKILGPDHMIWQYNFYPATPFVQQGSANNPLVYWLAVTAGTSTSTAMFGWKTATNHWNDDAVFGHLDPNGIPLLDWKDLRDPNSAAVGRSLDMAFAITTRDVPNPQPPPTNKWVQLPDRDTGLDVKATFTSIVADDFPCTVAGTITNIQIWASWRDNANPDPNTTFVLSFWSDIPASTATPFSRPGTLLWTETFSPGNYARADAGTGTELFFDPDTGQLTTETLISLYNFTPKNPFCQKGSTNAPIVYWLSVCAKANLQFGWKTSTNRWNDAAVYGHVNALGTALGDWRRLLDPRPNMNKIKLDMAFLLSNGPPSADCDPIVKPKYVQWPDPSTNGLDVKATVPNILADDFPCRQPGRINGITVWGSWLGDKVDPNVVFQLGLWTDVPKQTGTSGFSHPGQLLCTQTFYPPTSTVASLLRYKVSLAVSSVQERFYDPPGVIGSDTQIWRYDFYPTLPCWRQDGGLTAQKVYWLSLVATNTGTGANPPLFGWKTTTNHWNDDAVFGHVSSSGVPLNDWQELRDPRTNISLDLSFALRTFPIVSVNKDLINTTQQPADGIRIVVAGIREVTWHYDDYPPTPWPTFTATYAGGNTVLEWSGKTVAAGGMTHVGAQMAGSTLTIVSMAWLQGPTVIGTPIQLNHRLLGNGTVLVLANDFVPGAVIPQNAFVEFFADPTPLDQMNPNGNRTPLQTVPLQFQPSEIGPGGVMRIPLPPAPPEARYAMFRMDLTGPQGPATMDFLQLPLDRALAPFISQAGLADSFFDVFFDVIPGRTYRVRESPTLQADSFFDIFTELSAFDTEMNVRIPSSPTSGQKFYQIMLEPE